MGLLDVLKKLGILRYGAVSWSGGAKDRPVVGPLDDFYAGDQDLSRKKGEHKQAKE